MGVAEIDWRRAARVRMPGTHISLSSTATNNNNMAESEYGGDKGEEMVVESNWTETCETFDEMELREDLLRGIYAYGFEKPSAIQQVRCRLLPPCVRAWWEGWCMWQGVRGALRRSATPHGTRSRSVLGDAVTTHACARTRASPHTHTPRAPRSCVQRGIVPILRSHDTIAQAQSGMRTRAP